ncbi:MAG: glycosyltransferase family 4 protein [Acidimicrobiia bacterium]
MKFAFVTPRYGAEIHGGAEQAARLLAESIVARSAHAVEVFTSCATDAGTFVDAYPKGTTSEAGVTVHRFSAQGRAADFDARSNAILHSSPEERIARTEEWVRAQGPVSESLIEALRHTDADIVAFHPYLYHPTVAGMRVVPDRVRVLHPATHDEAPIYLPVFDEVFGNADGLVFWTRSEQGFANHRFSIASRPQIVLGIGVTPVAGSPESARAELSLADPYVLCLGRVDTAKGTDLLVRLFAAYKEMYPGPLKLVLAGPVRHIPPEHPDVVVAGPVEETTKWGLLRGAEALISPSSMESFSIVLLESWMAGTPVVVNGACDTTREHAAESNGGLWFTSVATFAAAVQRLVSDHQLQQELAQNGRAYVEGRYLQNVLTDRYIAFCEQLVKMRRSANALA